MFELGAWSVKRQAVCLFAHRESQVSSRAINESSKQELRKLTDLGRDLSLILHIESTHTCKGKTKRRQ